jgi:hypothetical protein
MNKICTLSSNLLSLNPNRDFPLAIVQETLDRPVSKMAVILPKHRFNPDQKSIDRILAYARK